MSNRRREESLQKFNEAASTYDSKSSRWTEQTHPYILAELKLETISAILDIGCGTGTLLSKVDGDIRKAGLDLSPEMLKKARDKLGAEVDLRVGDSEKLPWPKDSFDAVTINLSFHHYEHPETVLTEVHRVLKNNGRVIVGDMCPPFPLIRFVNLLMRFGHGGDIHLYSQMEMRKLLNQTGFQEICWKRTTRSAFIVSARVTKITAI
jgi:ubiquinone/menaquinone biosynthesis C-methylase UbiE